MEMREGFISHLRTASAKKIEAKPVDPPVDPRSKVYNSLLVKFAGVNAQLDDYGRTELDGLLWDLAYEIAAP
jgi:hypothetical protein